MRTVETKIYTISDHPNKTVCLDWIRNNWHDLNQHSVCEIINSLNKLKEKIGGVLDYSISQVPDRGEYITFKDYDHKALLKLNKDDLPLTGVCWDYEVIVGFRTGSPTLVLKALHSNTEYIYSDEGLTELCEAHEYEFISDGSIYND